MSNKKTGGPAFPIPPSEENGFEQCDGITMRDYFAAKAIQGWLANPSATPVEAEIDNADPELLADVAAVFGYMVADAMLKQRKA